MGICEKLYSNYLYSKALFRIGYFHEMMSEKWGFGLAVSRFDRRRWRFGSEPTPLRGWRTILQGVIFFALPY